MVPHDVTYDGVAAAALAERLAGATAGVASVGRLELRAEVGSTNTELLGLVRDDPESWPDLSVLVAGHQDAGRGRSGRSWHTQPGTALTVSVLLRPAVPAPALGWLPLLAGLAVVGAVAETAGVTAALKWPNDVVLDSGAELPGWGRWRKVAGILCEVAQDGAVVVGIGVNVSQAGLPVAHAVSLASAGTAVVPDRADLLVAVVEHLAAVYRRWAGDGGDVTVRGGPAGTSLREELISRCVTLGRPVLVQTPGGPVRGQAVDLAADGGLVLRGPDGDATVRAGDVHHIRASSDIP